MKKKTIITYCSAVVIMLITLYGGIYITRYFKMDGFELVVNAAAILAFIFCMWIAAVWIIEQD